jgi:cobalt-zinc-cadmium efflux system membrane fusion protein
MFGEARIQVPRPEPAVTVPRGAVQRARGTSLVFVREAPELFEARRVEVIDRPGDPEQVEVRGRIAPGDEVVVEGAFLLRTETVSDSIGAGCCGGEE